MVNDYAKRSNYQSRPQLRRNAFLIFGIFIFIIAFALLLILYHQKFHYIHSQKKTTNPAVTISKPELHVPAPSQTKFDFYILLPKMQVPILRSENKRELSGAKPT